jgi:elongation factor Ts
MNPLYVSIDAVPKEVWSAEESRIKEEAAVLGKSAEIMVQIIEGKLTSHFGGLALLTQSFVKDQDKTVGEFLNEAIGRFGENIKVGRFVRLEIWVI